MTPSEPIDIETFFADPAFASASLSSDGMRIAYLAPAHGRRQVWVRGIDDARASNSPSSLARTQSVSVMPLGLRSPWPHDPLPVPRPGGVTAEPETRARKGPSHALV